jgi:hypothetical protein
VKPRFGRSLTLPTRVVLPCDANPHESLVRIGRPFPLGVTFLGEATRKARFGRSLTLPTRVVLPCDVNPHESLVRIGRPFQLGVDILRRGHA